jgi:hypothetical protein
LIAGFALSVELDSDPRRGLEALEVILGPPTVTVLSGGLWTDPETGEVFDKVHAHWRLAQPACDRDSLAQLKQARRYAAAIAGGDPSNITSVHPIRWPGSWHRKNEPRMATIEHIDPEREIFLDDVIPALEAAAPAAKTTPSMNGAGGDDSADWDALISNILTAKEIYPTCPPLTMKLQRAGMNDGAVVNLTRAIVNLSEARVREPGRVQNAYSKIPAMVRTGREKIEEVPEAGGEPQAIFDPWETYIVPPFPLDVLPDVVREFVRTQSRIIGCDPSALAMCALANFSAVIDHRFGLKLLRHGQWRASPRLWVLLVGPSSDKKTPAFNAATYHLMAIEDAKWTAWEKEKAEALKADPKAEEPPHPARLWTADTTVEACGGILANQDRGLLVKRDEIVGWIGSMERYQSRSGVSSDRAFWLQSYDGGPVTVDRIKRGMLRIKNLSVTILGGIQPERLGELEGFTSDGMLQRFSPVLMRRPTNPIDDPTDEAFEAYGKLTRTLVNATPATLILTDTAYAAVAAMRGKLHMLEQESAGFAQGFHGFIGKLMGTFGSLALILHMLDEPLHGGAYPVALHHVQRAARLVEEFLLPHAMEFYRMAENGRPDSDRLRKAASYILTTEKTRIIPSDLTANVAGFRGLSIVDVHRGISPLVAGGWLVPENDGPFPKAWKINPEVYHRLGNRRAEEQQRKIALASAMGSLRKKEK